MIALDRRKITVEELANAKATTDIDPSLVVQERTTEVDQYSLAT